MCVSPTSDVQEALERNRRNEDAEADAERDRNEQSENRDNCP